ncbi:MAG: D-lyxose/D-mannose family sugar isomerase, partial [Armatimonadetes bacterium]|nr:D-lyxose/D-mannose family sugar isomerase [Armatimonadota bacterium]
AERCPLTRGTSREYAVLPVWPPIAVVESYIGYSTDTGGRGGAAEGIVTLSAGGSIFPPSGLYREFGGEMRKVLLGEESTVNDDTSDRRFL